MGKYEGSWNKVSQFAAWAESLNTWAHDYGIVREITADDDGQDPTGELAQIDPSLIWSQRSGDDGDVVVSGLELGDWNSGGVDGWYISSKPWLGERKFVLELLKEIDCPSCENGEASDSDDCDECETDGTVWLRLEDLESDSLSF